MTIEHKRLGTLDCGLVRYPLGHAKSDAGQTAAVVDLKFDRLVADAIDDPAALRARVRLAGKSASNVADLYAFSIHGCDPD